MRCWRDPAEFRSVAYKGGSDTGVLNFTTQVVTKHGSTICFSVTQNDAAKSLDDAAFESAYSAVLAALAAR
jgi:hypothetical protein